MAKRPGEELQNKSKRKELEWEVTIYAPLTFKTFLNVIKEASPHVGFSVCHTPFEGLRVSCIAESHTAVIKAAYECSTSGEASFVADASVFLSVLHDVKPAHAITLRKYTASDGMHVSFPGTHATIPLIDEDLVDVPLLPMTFQFQIEINTDVLKNMCRMVKALHTNSLEFRLTRRENNHCFTLRTTSDGTSITKVYACGQTRDDATGAYQILSSQENDVYEVDNEVVLNQQCSTTYISAMLKHMEKKTVMLHMGETCPLMMHYNLGGDESFIDVIMGVTNDE